MDNRLRSTDLIAQIDAELRSASKLPFSHHSTVNVDEVLGLLTQLDQALPDDLHQARDIIAQADQIIQDATGYSETTCRDADIYAEDKHRESDDYYDTTVNGADTQATTILDSANSESTTIVEQAQNDAQLIQNDAHAYADDIVADAERQASEIINGAQHDAELMVSSAERQAATIMDHARSTQARMVSETTVLKDARVQAQKIVDQAHQEAIDYRAEIENNLDTDLIQLSSYAQRVFADIETARSILNDRVNFQPTDDAEDSDE